MKSKNKTMPHQDKTFVLTFVNKTAHITFTLQKL